MIYGAIKGQQLKVKAQAAADTIDYLIAKFTFLTADWEGLTKYAHFTKGQVRYSVQLTDDEIKEEDHLNLTEGEWQIYLHGNEYRNGEVIKRVTTNIATFQVQPTGALNGEPFPETDPSVVEQLAAQVSDHEDRIESLEIQAEDFVKDVKTADGTSVVDENGVAHLPEAKTEMTEIKKNGNTANFTASEIAEMHARNTPMCYDGTPVSSILILTLAGGAKEAYIGILYTGTTVQEAQTLKINENKQITVYENGTTITEAQINKLAGIETGAEVNKVVDVLDSDGNSVVGADRKARLPQSGGGTITDVQDEQGNSLVSEGIATIPSEVVEIIRSYQLAYTPSEIETMFRTKELKISGKTVVDIYSYGTGITLNTQIYFIDRDDGEEYLYYNEYSYNGTTISTRNKVGRWSEANYTSTEKNKLSGIATGAEVNVIDTIKDSNGNPLTVTSKAVTLPAPPSVPVQDVEVNGSSVLNQGVAKITIPDISGKEDTANKVTSLSSSSTDTEYPSAKCVYDELQNIPSKPSGTADGQILVWDNTNQVWTVKPKWQMIYQLVEYIENSGTGNYIKTGYLPTVDSEITADMQITGLSGTREAVIGATTNANHRCCFGISVAIDSSKWYFGIGDTNLTGGTSDYNRHTFKLSMPDKTGYVDGVSIGGTATNIWASDEFTAFSRAKGLSVETSNYCVLGKLYQLTIEENNITVHDYRPAYNIYTGKIGLYDIVDNVFHEGTGTFTKGADVN